MIMIYSLLKRIFDVLLSFVLILLLSPLFFLILFGLLVSGNDLLYFQNRVGKEGKVFRVIKFSTMLRNSLDLPGGSITVRNDPRITRFGFLLRITKLNELPQLLNVFTGSMSFVGPRPYMKDGFYSFSESAQKVLIQQRPGITGISSVVFRDEEYFVTHSGMNPLFFYKNYIFPFKSELELWYYHNRSIYVDLMILALTGYKIVFPKSTLEYKVFKTLPKSDYFLKVK